IRGWAVEYERDGTLPSSRRGAHGKAFSLLNDPAACHAMREHLRQEKWSMDPKTLAKYSQVTMSAAAAEQRARRLVATDMPVGLKRYIEEELFPRFGVKVRGGVSLSTARRWMRREGFTYKRYAKGVYVDGHERADVVKHRQEVFIPTLDKLRHRLVEYEVGNVGVKIIKDHGDELPLEIIFHHESTFQAHDAQVKAWVLENQHRLRKKGVGRGVHRSDFIGPSFGWLEDAGVGMNYGKNHDGYWTGDDVCIQVSSINNSYQLRIDPPIPLQLEEVAIPAFKAAHPGAQGLWIFDNSSGHGVFSAGALRVKDMNLKPGGKQPIMKDGWYYETDEDGDPIPGPDDVGWEIVRDPMESSRFSRGEACGGRSLSLTVPKAGVAKGALTAVLAQSLERNQTFWSRNAALQRSSKQLGRSASFFPSTTASSTSSSTSGVPPRSTPEASSFFFFSIYCLTLTPEVDNCDYTFEGLQEKIPLGQAAVPVETMRRWFHRMMRWLDAYRDGLGAVEAGEKQRAQGDEARRVLREAAAAKVSHRRQGVDDMT
ncbi:hypothetical protein P7C70_g2193, partial [Phenoliferia sp. Uapishka_3]